MKRKRGVSKKNEKRKKRQDERENKLREREPTGRPPCHPWGAYAEVTHLRSLSTHGFPHSGLPLGTPTVHSSAARASRSGRRALRIGPRKGLVHQKDLSDGCKKNKSSILSIRHSVTLVDEPEVFVYKESANLKGLRARSRLYRTRMYESLGSEGLVKLSGCQVVRLSSCQVVKLSSIVKFITQTIISVGIEGLTNSTKME